MSAIRIRYWAAARNAAGLAEEMIEAPNCQAALDQAVAQRADPAELERVLAASSYLVDGVRRGREELAELVGPVVLEVLPPFAGG